MNEKGRIMDSHSQKKQRLNAKSCMAIFLSAVLLFTSIDYTQVNAEEIAAGSGEIQENTENVTDGGQGAEEPSVSNENGDNADSAGDNENLNGNGEAEDKGPDGTNEDGENPEDTGNTETPGDPEDTGSTEDGENPEDNGNPEDEENPNESDTDKETGEPTGDGETENGNPTENPEEPIIISYFEPLAEADSHIILEEKGTLEDVISMMPSALKAYAYVRTDEVRENTEEGASEGTSEANTESKELEIPVNWECSEDYDNTELESYNFLPVWDSAAYYYETDEEADEENAGIPTITVSIGNVPTYVDGIVSTQEELVAAIAAGEPEITLAEDIFLTDTLTVPASADTVLDGNGFSLKRGEDENGDFIGTMIYLGGEDYTEKDYGTLTLTNICVDGQTPGDHAGSSAIIDYGSLILDEGASIKNNRNYGTYNYDTDAGTETVIPDFGGGIQVYGKLKVMERALVTGNFADEFGGGVYLANGSVLYLHADVIKDNSVAEDTGYGADLYASNGSTIYYDPSIDMEREGFYICAGAILICMQDADLEPPLLELSALEGDADRIDDKVEVYISNAEGSGYSDSQILYLENELKKLGYSVITSRTDIDVNDLRDWYIYDHYDIDSHCWNQTDNNNDGVPDAWSEYYKEYSKRKYYSCNDIYSDSYYTNTTYYGTAALTRVYTIEQWLNNTGYTYNGDRYLSRFKEHIYSAKGGRPNMTFVGYGSPSYVDFMFYDPKSDGAKVVDFDLDSSKVNIHTLTGAGFLVNTGIKDGNLYGYLVYYDYAGASGTTPASLNVYKIDRTNLGNKGINIDKLHEGDYDLKVLAEDGINYVPNKAVLGDPIATYPIATNTSNSSNWKNAMSIQIKVLPNKIEVRQQPKNSLINISDSTAVLSVGVDDTGYSAFGPLVAYTSVNHTCPRASSFTYSNLSMYYINPTQQGQNMLQALERADYTQEGTQKYFLNLFGTSGADYNTDNLEEDLYQEYLKMMQIEGIALITDRSTPFEEYLGEKYSNESEKTNLCEVSKGVTIAELINLIKDYVGNQTTTNLQNRLKPAEGGEGLTNADPRQSVGNLWLKAKNSDEQVRTLFGGSFDNGEYSIEMIDDIAYYYRDTSDTITVKYDILKPNSSDYVKLTDEVSPSDKPHFVVMKDSAEWPAGQYTVRQTIISSSLGESSVHGYAYFDLDYSVCDHEWECTEEQSATCTAAGRKSMECSKCHEKDVVEIPALGHRIKDGWEKDETNHWRKCGFCDYTENASQHDFGEWEIDKKATEEEDGSKHRTCKDCEYDDTEEIEYGTMIKREDCGENAPRTTISMELVNLAAAMLEEAEIELLGEGKHIKLILTVVDADKTVSPEDDTAVKTLMGSYTRGQYFDVSLYKDIDGNEEKLTKTSGNIRLTVTIPDKFKNINTRTKRKFSFIRVHGGNAVILEDLDSDDSTVTIETDRFSTYALVYADKKPVSKNKGGGGDNIKVETYDDSVEVVAVKIQNKAVPQDPEPKTGQTSHFEIYATIALIEGVSYLMLLFSCSNGMTEEKKNEMVYRLIGWAKQGGKLRKMLAIAAIAIILAYYHSIGKKLTVEWSQA